MTAVTCHSIDVSYWLIGVAYYSIGVTYHFIDESYCTLPAFSNSIMLTYSPRYVVYHFIW